MIEIRTITGAIAMGVLLTFLIIGWPSVRPINRCVVLAFLVTISFSTFVRGFVYNPSIDRAPGWFSPLIDLGYIMISTTLVASIWSSILHRRNR